MRLKSIIVCICLLTIFVIGINTAAAVNGLKKAIKNTINSLHTDLETGKDLEVPSRTVSYYRKFQSGPDVTYAGFVWAHESFVIKIKSSSGDLIKIYYYKKYPKYYAVGLNILRHPLVSVILDYRPLCYFSSGSEMHKKIKAIVDHALKGW